ncbi:GxxExxY protein [Sedimentisphaera salicampi]|uniref:GxxExxY protein n=1 Tax=Sedimentisphaera salicampi TaxID=1941349 RepID=A0A1W6LLD6_9BACT|nr:GxxExxY protein [Sedimentisphaera salicampi]ARN56577.1 GxxExxY protein [Sedimentisphaera salicampi]
MEEKILYKELSDRIIGCAVEVHRVLGPGLLESAYNQCLCRELDLNGIKFEREKPLPVVYKDTNLDCGYRLDILVEGKVIVELKSVEAIKGIHEAQIISYMKLADVKKGFLINFNVEMLKNGLKSFAIK